GAQTPPEKEQPPPEKEQPPLPPHIASIPPEVIEGLYPSGHRFVTSGRFIGPVTGAVRIQMIDAVVIFPDRAQQVLNQSLVKDCGFLCDPRGLYREKDGGRVLYSPRDFMENQPEWVTKFLAENPDWPERVLRG